MGNRDYIQKIAIREKYFHYFTGVPAVVDLAAMRAHKARRADRSNLTRQSGHGLPDNR